MNNFYTAANVLDDSIVCLNDVQAGVFSYDTLLPMLKMVMRDFEQELDLAGFQINFISEALITVLANTGSVLTYPDNFFMPISLSERANGTTDEFVPMTERQDVNALTINPGSSLGYWDWRHNSINFIGSTTDRQVRLSYWRFLTEFADETAIADVRGGRNYLAYATAAMAALLIGQNQLIATTLGNLAEGALERFLSQISKNNQGKRVRRKPFRVRKFGYPSLLARIP